MLEYCDNLTKVIEECTGGGMVPINDLTDLSVPAA
jgi:hypothetical protein